MIVSAALCLGLLPLVAAQTSSIPPAAAPLRGTLPNGVSYVVQPNASYRGELSARLVVQAGSLDEHDDERGFAHLLQHLAADLALRLAPPALRAHAQQFRPGDAHAPPSFTHTTHSLDLTIGGASRVDNTLALLRQFADGLPLAADDLARVALQVQRELREEGTPQATAARDLASIYYGGTAIPLRDPQVASGLPERATAERLERFYRRTYRPDRMAVIVVGPVDAEAVAQSIARHFGALAAATEESPPARPSEPPPLDGLRPGWASLPDAPPDYAAIEIATIRPRSPDTPAGRRAELLRTVAITALDTQNWARSAATNHSHSLCLSPNRAPAPSVMAIAEAARIYTNDPMTGVIIVGPGRSIGPTIYGGPTLQEGFIPGLSLTGSFRTPVVVYRMPVIRTPESNLVFSAGARSLIAPGGRLLHNSVVFSSSDGKWGTAIEAADIELRRIRTDGFSSEEIAEAAAKLLSGARDRVAAERQLSSEALANAIALSTGEDRAWQTPAESLAAIAALQPVSPAEVNFAFADLFPPHSAHLILRSANYRAIEPARLLEVHARSAATPLSPRPPPPPLKFRYESSLQGMPFEQIPVADLNLTLATFDNGLRVNFRPARDLGERFRLCLVFPKGLADSLSKEPGTAQAAAYVFWRGPLARQSPSDIERLLMLYDVRAELVFDCGTPVLLVDAPIERLEFVFQLVQARFSDLDLTPLTVESLVSRFISTEPHESLHPGLLAFDTALRHSTGNDPRVALHPFRSATDKVSARSCMSWLKEHLLATPLEIAVVGDVPPDRVLAAAAATVGTLRKRPAAPKAGTPLKPFQKAAREEIPAPLPGNVGVSCALWPVTLPDDPRSDAAVALAADILRERLAAVVRSGLGTANTPEIQFYRNPVQRDLAFVRMTNIFPPPGLKHFTDASLRLATRLAESGVTAEELGHARAAALARAEAEMRSSEWWLRQIVAFAQSRPAVLEAARRRRSDLAALTREEVNAAARIFASDRITAIHLRPEPPRPNAATPTKAPAKK